MGRTHCPASGKQDQGIKPNSSLCAYGDGVQDNGTSTLPQRDGVFVREKWEVGLMDWGIFLTVALREIWVLQVFGKMQKL